MMVTVLRRAGAALAVAATLGLGAALAPTGAEARTFQKTVIKLDLATGKFDAEVTIGDQTFPIDSPTKIVDGVFAELDLRVSLPNAAVAERVQRRLDSGFTDEAAGCAPGRYGPLDMEDGLRYFFDVQTPQGKVLASFYPGNRSTHWTNDAFCEFDESLGQGGAVFRLTGYYFVIYRQVDDAQYIQLRAVTLTPSETDKLTGPKLPGQ